MGINKEVPYLFLKKNSTSFSSVIDKHRLVPLGEWLPSLPGINFRGLSSLGGLESGEASRLLDWQGGPPVAVAICYELTDGNALANATKDGAQWILSIANLDPYPISLQKQFLSLAQLRSIETARDLVSVANTGPSALISRYGQVRSIVSPFTEGVGVLDLNFSNEITGYVRWGELPLLFSLITSLYFITRLSKTK